MNQFEHYWLFASFCVLVALILLRLVMRERLTLQQSLSLLLFLLVMAGIAIFPGVTSWVASHMGFTLPSNFFFAIAIASLLLLHVSSLLTLSRVELRSIALTQELALLQEKLGRLESAKQDQGVL
jgi:hypothetical protein